jgi:hypothetical protein
MIREPAVAGSFYPADPLKLGRDLSRFITPSASGRRVLGVVSPHAGYVYSGAIAGKLYSDIDIPETVVILGPNHHGAGAAVAVSAAEGWETPLGPVPIDTELASLVLEEVVPASSDDVAHRHEHSLEVQVPFLRHRRPDVRIVPVCLGFGNFEGCRIVGEGVARAIRRLERPVLIVASSDMTHYEDAAVAERKDREAIRAMLDLDAEGLHSVCRRRGITMCGVVPAAAMLVACRELGASEARLVAYGTSGDVTGDRGSVVAYAALEVW